MFLECWVMYFLITMIHREQKRLLISSHVLVA